MSDSVQADSLNADARLALIGDKITCPFLGSAVHAGRLPLQGTAADPLARIEDIRALGNAQRQRLGDLLVMFAKGSHGWFVDSRGQRRSRVSEGLFSLDLPNSNGSHAGDSGILQQSHSGGGRGGKFDRAAFDRLARHAVGGRLTRTAFGHFIAENMRRDPAAQTLGVKLLVEIGRDLFRLAKTSIICTIRRLFGMAPASDRFIERFVELLAEDHIAASSGEFGLLFTILSGADEATSSAGEPAVLLEEVRAMFEDKQLPSGYELRRKTWLDWVKHTTVILRAAYSSHAAATMRKVG